MNSNDNKINQLKLLEKQIETKIEKLELLVSQLNSLFIRVDKLEETINQFNIQTTVKKQPVVYLDKEGKIKTLDVDKK